MERLDGACGERCAARASRTRGARGRARLWPAPVGDAIARAAWPPRISRDGTLLVATRSSTWAFELGLLADEILAKLVADVGPGAPPGIRFAPGR